MKKKPKKKKLKTIGKLKAEADRAVQDAYRRDNPGKKCEMCNKPYQVLHHFIFKSQSNYLRYEPRNYVFVCNGCHYKFHQPDPMIYIRLNKLRGQEWADWIEAHKRKLKSDKRQELIEIIERHKTI